MLDFSHTLVVCPFLFYLIPSVALRQGSVAIALRKGVEHPYIEKCALPISPPETLSHNVQPCTVFSIRCPVCKLLFGHRLQVGFSANAMTYLTQEVSGDVALKAPLWRVNPCSSMGKVESQLEAPFSAETVKAFWRLLGSLSLSSEAAVASCCLRRVRVSFLALSCSALVSDEYM